MVTLSDTGCRNGKISLVMAKGRKRKRITNTEIEELAAKVTRGELTFDEAAGEIPNEKKRNPPPPRFLPGSFESGKRR